VRIPPDAQIDDRKLSDYLLKKLPHDDKSGFLAQAGFDRGHAGELRAAILALCLSADARPYGAKWLVSGTITGPNGRELKVKLVWIERPDGAFHFVTLVPG
jgi:hypothetical protein